MHNLQAILCVIKGEKKEAVTRLYNIHTFEKRNDETGQTIKLTSQALTYIDPMYAY